MNKWNQAVLYIVLLFALLVAIATVSGCVGPLIHGTGKSIERTGQVLADWTEGWADADENASIAYSINQQNRIMERGIYMQETVAAQGRGLAQGR